MRVEDSELLHRLENSPGLSRADAEVIVLARGSSATAIIDDEFARRVASSLNVRVHGTIYLVEAAQRGQNFRRRGREHN
ncbi:hypothetical protein [Candidatus Pyrohabitans sp.]